MLYPPTTGLGQLQGELHDLQRKVNSKAESYGVYSLKSRVDSLERTMREISSVVDSFRDKLQELEANQIDVLQILATTSKE